MLLYASAPTAGASGSLALFVAIFCVILTMYGGGFATIPAYLADLFGAGQVSAIHGRLLTAWSAAGVLGPVLVNYIREFQIGRGVRPSDAYTFMISFSRISKQYGRQVLFVDASFQLNPGEKVGLVGPNGSGKTTLFRMIVGEEAPDEGEVSVPKKLTVGYFRQDVEEMSGRSVLDEAIAGSGRARRSAPRARGSCSTRWAIRRAPATWTASSRASAKCRRNTSTSAATRSRRRRAKCSTASASTTSGSTATSARSPAAGRCAWRWRACCSAVPTCC